MPHPSNLSAGRFHNRARLKLNEIVWSTMSFRFLSPQVSDPLIDVVFVHGLRIAGDTRESDWRNAADPVNMFWPEWLREDIPGIRVGELSYLASASKLLGSSMRLDQRAMNLLADLRSEGVGLNCPVVFVAHSLGGLVVKEMLVRSSMPSSDFNAIGANCRGVVFIATPHAGSWIAIAMRFAAAALLPTAAIETLSNGRQLSALAVQYRMWVAAQRVDHLVLYETFPTKGFRIVSEKSANPLLPGALVLPVDADHNTIAKPKSRADFVYQQTKYFLEGIKESVLLKPTATEGIGVAADDVAAIATLWRQIKSQLLLLESRRGSLLELEEKESMLYAQKKTAEYLDATHLEYLADRKLEGLEEQIESIRLDIASAETEIVTAQTLLMTIPNDAMAALNASGALFEEA
jgi:hypothetical protein